MDEKRKKVAKQKGRKRKDKRTLDAETVAAFMYTGKKTPHGGGGKCSKGEEAYGA